MNDLRLPDLLARAWENCLILTYGADLPFFENALWGQLGSCRNKIILADGRQYLTHCVEWARSGAVRSMNQRYVAEGIFVPHAAHAKMILLTQPKAGRLLVGSGNLGLTGYASGGELFTQYDYSIESPEHLGAFLTAWDLVEGMWARGFIPGLQARRSLDHLFEGTPWLMGTAAETGRPVRHNLTESFLEQLATAVGGRDIEELWVLSPFFDREAAALDQMLSLLQPRLAVILVQPGATSLDPTSLQRVLDKYPSMCEVRPVTRGGEIPYIHAKLYLARLRDAAICLQGSPNLSQVAMLLAGRQGNIELANLVEGRREAFDPLMAALNVGQRVRSVSALDLSLEPISPLPAQLTLPWQLLAGEWKAEKLRLWYRGQRPDLSNGELLIARNAFPLEIVSQEDGMLQVRLPQESAGLLGRPVPVTIRWCQGTEVHEVNPVFLCNQAALEQEIEAPHRDDEPPRIGSLDLDDAEIEGLLGKLDSALVIDRRSLWQVAGRQVPTTVGSEEDAPPLSYIGIDYDLLRRHPKIQQYLTARTGGTYRPTRLQIILNAIVDHFRVMLSGPPGTPEPPLPAIPEDVEGESPEEREENDEERRRRQLTAAQRTERILKNFVNRYLRGLRSPDFQAAAGYEVMVHNYGIFTYLLWRLFAKDWLPSEFVAESLLTIWGFFWGDEKQAGYYWQLSEEERVLAREWLNEQYGDGHQLAALAWSAGIAAPREQEKLRFALRDFWRSFLVHSPFEPSAGAIEVAWRGLAVLQPYASPLPSQIIGNLTRLAEFETRESFLRTMEQRYGCAVRSWRFEVARVARESAPDGIGVECLVMPMCGALTNQDRAMELLQAWMRWAPRDYYRIASPGCNNAQRLIFYDRTSGYGLYRADGLSTGPVEFSNVPALTAPWDASLSRWHSIAAELESRIVLPIEQKHAVVPHATASGSIART